MTAACQQVSVASDIPEKETKHLRRSLLSSADGKWNPAASFITPKSQDEFLRYGKKAFNIKKNKKKQDMFSWKTGSATISRFSSKMSYLIKWLDFTMIHF